MQIEQLHVDFKKTVSDGNYGNETYTVGYTVTLAPDESSGAVVENLSRLAREHVYARLKESATEGIRYALETDDERERRYIFECAEREANYEKAQAQRHQWRREAHQQYGLPVEEEVNQEARDDDDDSPF